MVETFAYTTQPNSPKDWTSVVSESYLLHIVAWPNIYDCRIPQTV